MVPTRHCRNFWTNHTIGLHSCQLLCLVTLHCAMNLKQPIPITNVEQLMILYPTSFDTFGQFKGDYHIVLKPGSQPVVHVTRKCPIQMRSEIKQTLYDKKKNGIIRKVAGPTPGYLVSHTHAREIVNYVYVLTQKTLTKTVCALTTKLLPLKKFHTNSTDPHYLQSWMQKWLLEHYSG